MSGLNYLSLVLNALTLVMSMVLFYAGETFQGVLFLLLSLGLAAIAYRNLKRKKT